MTAVTDPVVQSTAGTATSPSAINNFEGVNNLDGVYPPDTNGDVGPNHYVQWVNLHFEIFNKSGVSLYGPASGNTLWSGFGGPCQTQNSGDPIALYDPLADRWVMAQLTSSSPYGECVAVSTTADPTGSYYRYFFQFSTSTLYDYPHLGVWPDGYYLSANRFGGLFGGFQGASAIVLDRAHMLLGQAAGFQQFNTSTSYGTLLPADLDGTAPPTNSPEVFAEIGSTALHLWKFHVDWATPASSTFSGPSSLGVAAFNQLCPSTRSCIPQPGTSVGLDGLGDRLMYRLAYRNFGDHESLVVNHAVNVASTGIHAGVRWYEVRYTGGVATGTVSLYQQGSYAPDIDNRWLGSVAMDGSGNIALGYSVASTSTYASIRYTGRLVGDPLGQMTQGEASLIAGSGSQTGSASRWGDYSMMAVDPVDNCTFWFTTEYMPSTGPAPWRTRIGSFKFPGCAPAAPDFSLAVAPASQSVVQGASTSYTATVTPSGGFSGSVTLSASGLPAGAAASFNPNPTTSTSTLTVTTSTTTPTGSYPITITGVSGSLTHTTSATLVVSAPTAADFALSVSPQTRSIVRGMSTSYTVTITPSGGFSGSVTLSASGLPAGAAASFNPNPTTSTSSLTVTTGSTSPIGSFTLTITGVSGSLTHSTSVTLKLR